MTSLSQKLVPLKNKSRTNKGNLFQVENPVARKFLSQRVNSEVKPVCLDDDTDKYSCMIKNQNSSYTHLVRMIKIPRCRRPEALA